MECSMKRSIFCLRRKRPYAILFLLIPVLIISCSRTQKERLVQNFNSDWFFNLADTALDASIPDFDDSGWRVLDLPHDWSIEGAFSPDNPATPGGGALPGGIGWYRKSFFMSEDSRGKLVNIEFDGVYMNSEVWINGHYLGKRPYGYSSFAYRLNPFLYFGDTLNTLAVRVDNSNQPNSRWYSGSGIYRDTRLVITDSVHISHWGVFARTTEVNNDSAHILLSVNIDNESFEEKELILTNTVYNKFGRNVASVTKTVRIDGSASLCIDEELLIEKPELWSPESPALYNLETSISFRGKRLDDFNTPVGIRYFSFDPQNGFSLNGEPVQIRGVCEHHDLGALGAATNRRAIERKLEILGEMGCNAIRTAHNPPAPLFLDLCDEMGFLVMDETFDMWAKAKTEYDYHLHWDEWHERDLRDHIIRDRNHPSVIIWSIGNEIPEQWDNTGKALAIELADIVRSLDNTRPVTSACNFTEPGNSIIGSGALDLVGLNYHEQTYKDFPDNFPGQKLIASETTSALQTRSSYDRPSDSIRRWPYAWDRPFNDGNPDYTCSAYDNCSAPWGATHEENILAVNSLDFLSGYFVWTGFDYIGEPTPYSWPARSSYFGIIDLAGFPKDVYYLYRSQWTDKPVLHLFPHWNWTEGDTVDVLAYSNRDEVELFLNGTSLGKKENTKDRLHMMWRVPFTPGVLKAVGVSDKDTLITTVETTEDAVKLVLSADRDMIYADGDDLSYITVTAVDEAGRIVPFANNRVTFSVEGQGTLAGVDNGLQTSHDSFNGNEINLWHGFGLAILRAEKQEGSIVLKVAADNLESAQLEIKTVL